MFKPIRRLELVEGGNIIRQGDHFTLGLQPFNADGTVSDLTGKSIQVTLTGRKGIVYETAATFSNDVIRFTVSKDVGYGKFNVELTVTDSGDSKFRQKYPADNTLQLQITASADNLEYGGVNTITVEQLKAELRQIQSTHESVVDARIGGISATAAEADSRSHQALSTANEANTKSTQAVDVAETVRGEFNRVVKEAGSNNPEVVQARGEAETLGERLDGFTQQLASTNRETQTLQSGVAVLNGEVNAPASVEIEGRTLTSLGNSQLEPGKQYVVADKKTRVVVDGKTVNGVGKFIKTGVAERPSVIRVANFEGKVSGSTVENPHVGKFTGSSITQPPTGTWGGELAASYSKVSKLDNDLSTTSSSMNGGIAQQLFSFNLIEEVERNIGRIPRTTVADKVAWLRANVARLGSVWHGFGSSVGGNRATIKTWGQGTLSWRYTNGSTSLGTVQAISNTRTDSAQISDMITSDGFFHILAHAEPSDGTTPSVINTDYVELEIELKPDADFTHPKVPLYEVTADAYSKIGVEWNDAEVMKRYSVVEGVQHLQGVGVVAEGENLLPPFTEWTLHANAKVVSPYELELAPTSGLQLSETKVKCLPSTTYYFDGFVPAGTEFYINSNDKNKSFIRREVSAVGRSFTTATNADELQIYFRNLSSSPTGTFTFKKPILTLGATPKPFVPRNPSYLFADVKLGAIGNVRDMLYEQDGRWLLRKTVEKDVVLDGKPAWTYIADFTGFKRFAIPLTILSGIIASSDSLVSLKYNGNALIPKAWANQSKTDEIGTGSSNLFVMVSDADTGFGETYAPTANDLKRYFNGWKYTDGTTWTSVTGNGQTATAQQALDTKPTGYTPYKLSYVLATPQIIDVTDKVEGALKVNGLTQVEVLSGVVVREKANPILPSGWAAAYINSTHASTQGSNLQHRLGRVIDVFENGKRFNKWRSSVTNSENGNYRIEILVADFDPTAEYTVTYIALDKHQLTANPTNVKLTYAKNIRGAVDDTATKVQDNTTKLSIHDRTILDLYIRLKALEGM